MTLSGIFIYPVKSLRGCSLASCDLDPFGLVGDRRFLVVDKDNRFLTQRTVPLMARIDAALSPVALILSAEGSGSIEVRRAPDPEAPLRRVTVWKDTALAGEDCGDSPAVWISDFLHQSCRLVRIGTAFRRAAKPGDRTRPGDSVGFADSHPFLLVGEASLDGLNDRLVARGAEPVPMDRFRPNLVISGCKSFGEDFWIRFRIGGAVFRTAGPCARCVITTTDQTTGERGIEPLRTLADFRRDPDDPSDVNFGQNVIHESKSGTLRLGDPIEVLELNPDSPRRLRRPPWIVAD